MQQRAEELKAQKGVKGAAKREREFQACIDAIEALEGSDQQIAARFHHRLVSIHPFSNGNGRHSRLMTDVLLENVLREPRFSWGGRDLSRSGDQRKRYIAALRAADGMNYEPLLAFVRS